MIKFGLDSTSMVPVAGHHAVGSTVAIRYLGHDTSKVVTRSEYDAYKTHNIDLFLVFEDGGRPDLHNYADGKANAEFALKQGMDRLGPVPRPLRCTFAWDTDPNANPAAADPYFDGCAAVFGHARCGPYGGKAAISHLANRGFKTLYQTYAWSAGQWDPRAKVRQFSNDHFVAGVDTDYDHIIPGVHGDYGQVDFTSPAPVDQMHYARFPDVWWKSPWGRLRERHVVWHYDGARKHPEKYHNYLHKLEAQLDWLANRVYFEVHHGKVKGWGPYWRHWRWPQLHNRSKGHVFTH